MTTPRLEQTNSQNGAPTVDLGAPGVYHAHLLTAYQLADQIRGLPLTEMVNAISLAETTGPILDPTLFRKAARAMSQDKQVLEILAFAQRKLEAVRR